MSAILAGSAISVFIMLAMAMTVLIAGTASAKSFYEREPADIFMGGERDTSVSLITVSESGTVRAELSNGLVVLLKENRIAPIALVQVTVRTGSINEQEYLGAGISHLFEHLMHGGTTSTRSEAEARRILQSIGNMTNAYTSYDKTGYYIKTTSDNTGTAIDLLADWMMNTQVTQEEFDREMQVVQREYERTYTSPERILFRTATESMFRIHPIRHPILGYEDVRARVTLEDIRAYRARMYVPNNMVVTIVGDFEWQAMLEKVRAAFGGFAKGAVPALELPREPEQVSPRTVRSSLKDLNRTLMSMSYRTVPLTHPDLYALDVLASVLGQSESSRLIRLLRDERRLVQSVSTWSYTPGFDAGQFTFYANIADAEKLPEVQQLIEAEIRRIQAEPIDQRELQRVKNQVAADRVYANERVETQARSITEGFLSAGDPDFDERYLGGIQAVTAEDVQRVANFYLQPHRLCTTILEPEGTTVEKLAEKAAVESVETRQITLDNGLRVLLRRNPAVPVVALDLFFGGGLRVETAENSGISNFATALWQRGTKNRTAHELADELDYLGADLGTNSGNYTIYLRASSLSKDFDALLDIVGDVVLNPAFDEEECEKLRSLLLSGIRQRDDSIYSQTQRTLFSTFYGEGNPYGLYPMGEAETVGAFTAQQLAEYYRTWVRGSNGVLAVFGDIDLDAAEQTVRKIFSQLSAEPVPEIQAVPAVTPEEDVVKTIYRDRRDGAAVYVAFPGSTLSNVEDRYALQVMEVILAGGRFPSGWLHSALRGGGLVYEVHGFNMFGLDPRHFQIRAITNPAAVDKVREIISESVAKMKQGEFTDDEFELARNICISEELMSKSTNADQSMAAAIDELYGLGYDFSRGFADGIRKVTREDVVRVANKYLTNSVTVIATPREEDQE